MTRRTYVLTAAAVILAWSAGLTSAASFTGLGFLSGGYDFSLAHDVSADGTVVVGYGRSGNGDEAFRWTESGGMVGLGDLPGGSFNSQAIGVSDDGLVVVGDSSGSGGLRGFRWTETAGIVLLSPALTDAMIEAVSADGTTVVGLGWLGGKDHAFRWTEANGMEDLGLLPGGIYSSHARGVSPDGSVVVGSGSSANPGGAFRWTQDEGMVSLGVPPGAHTSNAFDVSADGSVVVGSTYGDSSQAFVWDSDGGILSLHDALVDMGVDLAGWQLQYATGVSADGLTIVGTGLNPAGRTEAWIAVVPEPASLSLLLLGGLALLRRSR